MIFKPFREIVRYENRSLNCLLNVFLDGLAGFVHYMEVRLNENPFKLTFNREIAVPLLEYNCFDYCFQVLFVNVIVWIWLWVLTLLSTLNISVNITYPEYYDSHGLNGKLKLIRGAMNFFSKKLLGHEIFSPLLLWVTKYLFKNL